MKCAQCKADVYLPAGRGDIKHDLMTGKVHLCPVMPVKKRPIKTVSPWNQGVAQWDNRKNLTTAIASMKVSAAVRVALMQRLRASASDAEMGVSGANALGFPPEAMNDLWHPFWDFLDRTGPKVIEEAIP